MIYGLVLRVRHLLYDKGWKKSYSASVPTICLGNIAAGGTGKTPHTELILRTLQEADKAAVLSRGYKRKSRGFQTVAPDDSAWRVGDEPLQIAAKFPAVEVAVDKDRVRGCEKLALYGARVIVLDDAFQYRRLQADLNIVLVDYAKPIFKDRLLPWGRLRDLPSRIRKAQVVIVSKCPAELSEEERADWRTRLKLTPSQQLFFTTLRHCTPKPVFPEGDSHYLYAKRLILISGIANDTPLRKYLSDNYTLSRRLAFPDHHRFSRKDIKAISAAAKENPIACLMTTEKDAQRLRDCTNVPQNVRERLFYVPIEATFLTEEEAEAFTWTVRSVLK